MSALRQSRPGSLWSLWELIERHSAIFSEGFANLTEAKHLAALYGVNGNQPPEPGIRLLAKQASRQLRQALILADMDNQIPALDRLDMAIDGAGRMPLMNLSQAILHTLSGIRDDLRSEFFFHLDQRDVPLYQEGEPFGRKVASKFPKAAEDIEEAAKCLALQRPTASVFHLMRAMEVIVQRLGKKLGVQNIDKEWGKILSDIGKAVEAMPKTTSAELKKRNRWSEAHTQLYHVKQAWRNDTMHPKQTYTREQAHEVFNATRVFASHLAGLL